MNTSLTIKQKQKKANSKLHSPTDLQCVQEACGTNTTKFNLQVSNWGYNYMNIHEMEICPTRYWQVIEKLEPYKAVTQTPHLLFSFTILQAKSWSNIINFIQELTISNYEHQFETDLVQERDKW